MSENIRLGIVGAGKFGGYHAAKAMAHAKVHLAGVYDVDVDATRRLAGAHEVQEFKSFDDMLSLCQAIIIASPARTHASYAIKALKAGRHLLIEKPLAVEIADAEALDGHAAVGELAVQVGHQERFVGRAIGLDKIVERPILILARRLNPFSPRGTDTSVTMDLMTHDIDFANWLLGSVPEKITGRSRRVRSDYPDHMMATLSYSRAEVFLEASRMAMTGKRTMEITYPSGTIFIDFNAKTLEHNTPFDLDSQFSANPLARDSLAAGLDEFISAILERRTPFISVRDGLNAMRVAHVLDHGLDTVS